MSPELRWAHCRQPSSRASGTTIRFLIVQILVIFIPSVAVYQACLQAITEGVEYPLRLGTFFDIQNRLLLLTSKIQIGYWFFHHIKNRLLFWTYVSKQVPVIDNLGVQLSVVQVVWTIQNHVTIYDLIANTGCLAKKQTGHWLLCRK